MADKDARSGTVTPTPCASCGGPRELVRNGARTAARCEKCGAVEDVDLVVAPRARWTVVGPDGAVKTFASQEEMIDAAKAGPLSAPDSALPSTKRGEVESEKAPPVTDAAAVPEAKPAQATPAEEPAPPAPIVLRRDSATPPPSVKIEPAPDSESVLSVRDLTVVAMPKLPPPAAVTVSAPPPPLPAAASRTPPPPVVTGPPPPLAAKPRLKTLAPPQRHDAPPPPPPSIAMPEEEAPAAATSAPPPASR
ncbi:MAG: hypothetical protein JWP97_1466, partial [Labilithrix sp.]|nr:hypothetical protein [Labilithrix sp.]